MRVCLLLVGLLISASTIRAQSPTFDSSRGDSLATEYFRNQTEELTTATFAEIQTLDDWTSRRDQYREQLLEMLGLSPFPKRTPLNPVVTGSVAHDEGFVVENLQFQSMPGVYVTGNLYRPAEQNEPLPAILYVCGHGAVRKDGVSFGNKVNYQHHGAWFARNGYVCLTIDTIQLGELEGIHHGTYREKMWWWNNRGYTPAGVEAWNCVRALDYLQDRKEVNAERLGVTGRSGGGAYSWWIAAIDERIKAAVPVAGITSLTNHVVDGCVEGHCDCMYMVNTYRWDYPMVAALVAPRPLLISNTDKDRIFPLDGVVDVHSKTRRIYDLYEASDQLGLQITEGPHKDTQELRIHAFRWFNRFLKEDVSLIDKTAIKFFEPEQLKVFTSLPRDERVTTIHESFVPAVNPKELPQQKNELQRASLEWMNLLKNRVFRGWPVVNEPLNVRITSSSEDLLQVEYDSQAPYRLGLFVYRPEGNDAPLSTYVIDQERWETLAPALAAAMPEAVTSTTPNLSRWKKICEQHAGKNIAWIVPRGVGPTEWSRDLKTRTQIRRRFMQIGQTAATMQIYDVRRALQALSSVPNLDWSKLHVHANGEAAFWTLYASLWTTGIHQLTLTDLPIRNRDAPDLLNISRFVELPHVVLMAAERVNEIALSSTWESILGDHPLIANALILK
ncbi:MAG: CocE/NonD family hydrolase [Planctomycetota bacterium]|nr:CocE/NonD family hydrolase [Planctomycetota bacterium]